MIEEGIIRDLSAIGAQPLEPGDPERIGAFPIRGVLGSGGMGRVYLGVTPDCYAAVKQVLPYLANDPTFQRHFGHELDNQARLPPRVSARLLAADRTARPPWFATEYIPGATLHDAVHLSGGSLPAELIWVLLRELAARLKAVAALGMVHRDLKPSNVMLTAEGVTLIDFGVSRAAEQSTVTATGRIVGTPAYMAPEQARAVKDLTPAVDVFSLGALLHFAVTAEPPFGEGSGADVLYRIVHQDPDLDRLRALDPELAEVVAACLAKDPTERPAAQALYETACEHAEPGAPAWPEPVVRLIEVRQAFAATAPAAVREAAESEAEPESAGGDPEETALETELITEPLAPDEIAPDPSEQKNTPEPRRRSRKTLMIVLPLILVLGGTAGTLIAMNRLPFVTNNGSGGNHSPLATGSSSAGANNGAGSRVAGSGSGSATASASAPASAGATASTTAPAPSQSSAAAGGNGGASQGSGSAGSGSGGSGSGGSGSGSGGGAGSGGGGGGVGGSAPTTPATKTSGPSDPTAVSTSPGQLKNVSSRQCLEDNGNGSQMVPCSNADNQLWYAKYLSGSDFELINKGTGNCLDDMPSYTGINCGSSNTWSVGSVTSRGSTLVASFAGYCLAVNYNEVYNSVCNSSDATQLWYQP